MNLPENVSTPLLSVSQERDPQRPAPTIADAHKAQVTDPQLVDVDAALRSFFTSAPKWLDALLQFRNAVLPLFGFETGPGGRAELPERFAVGDEMGTFTLLDRSDDEIILGGEDKRFGLEISVWLPPGQGRLQVTTVARPKDVVGRVYLAVVAVPHGPIAAMLTKRMAAGG